MKRTRICIISSQDNDKFIETQVIPSCDTHYHVELSVALLWHDYPKINCIKTVKWAAPRMLMVEHEEGYEGSFSLAAKNSGGIMVVQRVRRASLRSDDAAKARTYRKRGIAPSGTHLRQMSARAVNREVDATKERLPDVR